jgi:hypothetical protein
MSNSILDSL